MKKRLQTPTDDILSTQNLVITDVWIATEQLRLLNCILHRIGAALGLAALGVLISAVLHGSVWQLWLLFAIMLLGLGGYALAVRWSKRGKVLASSWLLISVVAVIGLVLALLFEDLVVAFAILGLLISLMAGVLISRGAGFGFAIALLVVGLGFIFILRTPVLIPITLSLSQQAKNWIDLLTFLLTIFLGTYLVATSQDGTRLAFERLVEQSNRLKVLNRDLAHEIHERKQAEAALARLNSTLEASVAERTAEAVAEKDKSEAILRSVGDAISVTDLDMRIQYVNEAFVTLTGYSSAEIVGRPMYTLMVQETAELDRRSRQFAWQTGVYSQREITMRHKSGRTYDAVLTIASLQYEGEPTGYIFSHQDITKFKALERARSQFITNVSHELRTPVTSIKLSAYLLQSERSAENAVEYLHALERQSARLEHLIEDILEIASLDSGQGVTTWKPVHFALIVTDTAMGYQNRASARNVTLTADPGPGDLPEVNGDPSRLQQALKELVENALIFTPPGGDVHIALATVEDNARQWVTLAVRDTGPGISPDEKPKLFNRFFRGVLAESGHVPGTGLGLSIVDEIVRAHGGHISVESELGHGSTFTLWLPGV
ncbi:MAG: PAS domain S-box protein [Anaerolineae bacterium]|nr:PAS domain S-box protein [Anaerolineae bacterium]